MKKVLLTLGTAAAITTPLATVVACDNSIPTITKKPFEPSFDTNAKELTVARTTYVNKSDFESTITEESIKSFINDLHTVLLNSVYDTSEKIKLTKNGDETKTETITISDITFDPGTTSTNINPTTLAEVKALSWQAAENASVNGKNMDLTADQNMTWQLFSKEKTIIIEEIEDESTIKAALEAETFTSNKTKEQLEAVASETAISVDEANTKFGVNSIEFAKITAALGNYWEFVSLGYDISKSELKLIYRNKQEQDNKELNLTTTFSTIDDLEVREYLSRVRIQSVYAFTELIAAAGTPATTEADANTRFGILQAEFDKITTALSLGGYSSAWDFVNIDFNIMTLKIKLSYKFYNEANIRQTDLSIIVATENLLPILSKLDKLTINSTFTLSDLILSSGYLATSKEYANIRFGINSIEFKKITDALGSDWEFIDITFDDKINEKFILGFKHKYDPDDYKRTYLLNATSKPIDGSLIENDLNKLDIYSSKTTIELINVAGTPATSETDANTRFGILQAEFDKIITALGREKSDWKFVNIDFDTTNRNFKLIYKHSSETDNREIDLTTIPIKEDDSKIIVELNNLKMTSTKTLTELNATAGIPAITEEEASTRFGIVKDQFDSIIAALGGTTSDWEFVNIDFDTTNSKFRLTYKHSSEKVNREVNLFTLYSNMMINL